jgi:hypothetical protein
LKEGASIVTAKETLGHAKLETTMKYSHAPATGKPAHVGGWQGEARIKSSGDAIFPSPSLLAKHRIIRIRQATLARSEGKIIKELNM